MADQANWSYIPKGIALSRTLLRLLNSEEGQQVLLKGLQIAAIRLTAAQLLQCMYQKLTRQMYQELTKSGTLEEFAIAAPWTLYPFGSERPGATGANFVARSETLIARFIVQPAESTTATTTSQHYWEVLGEWLILKLSGQVLDEVKRNELKCLVGKQADCYFLAFRPSNQHNIPPLDQIQGTLHIRSSIDPCKYIRVDKGLVDIRTSVGKCYFCKDVCVWHVSTAKPSKNVSTRGPSAILENLGLRAAGMLSSTQDIQDKVCACFALGKVDDFKSLLYNKRQLIGKLSDVKDGYDRSLLSLLCTEVNEWPPFSEKKILPAASWKVKIELYNILLDYNEPETSVNITRHHTRKSHPTKQLLLSLFSSDNNKKARPLSQLMFSAKQQDSIELPATEDEFVDFMGILMKDLQKLPSKSLAQEVLLANSRTGWKPYHNAVKMHNKMALRIIIKAIVDAMIDLKLLPKPKTTSVPGNITSPPAKRPCPSAPFNDKHRSALQNCFYHPVSRHYKPEARQLLETTVACVLSSKYGSVIMASDLQLKTVDKEEQSEPQPVVAPIVAPSQQLGTGNAEQLPALPVTASVPRVPHNMAQGLPPSIANFTMAQGSVAGTTFQDYPNMTQQTGQVMTAQQAAAFAAEQVAAIVRQQQQQPEVLQQQQQHTAYLPLQMPTNSTGATTMLQSMATSGQMHWQLLPTYQHISQQLAVVQQQPQQWLAAMPMPMQPSQHIIPNQPPIQGSCVRLENANGFPMQCPASGLGVNHTQTPLEEAMCPQLHNQSVQMQPVGQYSRGAIHQQGTGQSLLLPNMGTATVNLLQQQSSQQRQGGSVLWISPQPEYNPNMPMAPAAVQTPFCTDTPRLSPAVQCLFGNDRGESCLDEDDISLLFSNGEHCSSPLL